MQGLRLVRFAGVRVVPLAVGMLAAAVSARQAGARGGEDAIAWYRSLAGPMASGKAQSLASGAEAPARGKLDTRADFYERIRPYLSAGGYYSLFGAGPVTRAPGAPLPAAPQAPVSEPPNEPVNDPAGEMCFVSGCTQSEPSIAVSGSDVVIGFNDSRGSFDGTNDISGYSYSVDGGINWIDGGSLPLAGGDSLSGDPALVFCNGSFYYASLYRTPPCKSTTTGGSVEEIEPNDDFSHANPVSLGDDFVGNVSSSSDVFDVDFVTFSAPAGTLLDATTVLGTLPDSLLVLFDAEGTGLASAVGFAGGPPARIDFEIPVSGTYFLGVLSLSGSPGSYTLQIRSCAGSVLPAVSAVSVSRGVFSGPALVWGAPVVAAAGTGQDFLDKDYIACDPSTGALYVAYTRFLSGTGQIELVRSTDGGTTWLPPTVVEPEAPPLLNQGAMPAVGPGGEVYVAWEQGGMGTSSTGRATIQLQKSVDGGATFPMKTPVAEFVATDSVPPLGLFRILDFPSIAVDRSGGPHGGNVYVAFEEADRDVRDIKLARSTTGGSSFDPAVRVNDDPPGADQFFPWVAVDPTDGQISVISYDRRLNTTPGFTDVFLTQSNDGGATFVPGVRVTDKSSSFLVNTDAVPNFGDYINVAAAGGAIYATWTDGRNGDPDVFFSSVAKDTAPFVLLQSFSLDDSGSNGDGDGVPEPGESPRLKVALRNPGAGAATHVSAMLTTGTPGITIVQGESAYGDLSVPGSTAPAQSLYQFRVDPSLECSRTVVCPPISTLIYGVDPGGTVVRFAFDTGLSASVPTPGDQPSGGPDGLAVQSPTDAFWVSGFGMDRIIEFNPQTGEQILGPFPIPSPGAPNCTDGLALAAPTRLFSQNFCEGKLYEIDTRTGLVANGSLPGGLGLVGGLAGGDGRLFATVFGTTIAEIDPHSGAVLNSFLTPDLNGDGFPDTVFGLAFDGTYLLAASVSAPPPNVAALDPANGKLVAVSPFRAPSGFLSALDAVAGPSGSVCVAGTFRTVVDFELAIATDQGPFSSSQSIPLGREAKTTAFRDNVESGINGWTPTGDWRQTTDRAASSSTHAWYFGRENGPGLRDNAYGDSSAGDLTSPLIDLSGARSAALVFDQYLARELCCDFATVSASGDGFRTQTMLASLDPAVDPSFSEVRLDLSAFAGSSTVQVRFTFRSDPSVDFEGWYVDNIRVEQSTFDCGLEIGLTTTTTLPAFRCQRDADCDDGDPCTTDDCAAGQCVFSPLGGSARAQCKFDSAVNNPLCGSTDRVDPRLEHFVTAQLRKAKRLLQVHASGTPKQINRLIRRVDRELLAVLTRVGKARRMGRISAGCRDMIEGRINELRQAIAGLRS